MEYQSGAVSPVGSIEEGWRIIKDDYWTFFLITLVAIVILVVASMIFGFINNIITSGVSAVLGIATKNASDAGKVGAAVAPQLLSMVISIFTNVIVSTLTGVLFCGIYKALSRKSNSGMVEFADLFTGFEKFQPCLIISIIVSIVGFVIGIVMIFGLAAVGLSAFGVGMLVQDGKLNPAVLGGLLFAFLGFLVVAIIFNLIYSALTAFIYPLIAERNLSGGDAFLTSVKSGLANIGGLILLLLLLGLMGLGGALVCLVGVLFVAPLIYASLFAAFQSVFGRVGYYQQQPPPPPNFGQQPGY